MSVVKVLFVGDTRDLEAKLAKLGKEARETEEDLDKIGSGMQKAGKVAMAGAAVAAVGLFKAGQAASDLNETVSKSNTVFKDSAKEVEKWANGAASDFGQSKRAALDAAGSFGNLFVQIGVGVDEAAKLSMEMTELASDFASFHNADITEVITAQTAAFRGEYDALQRFVPTINAAAVETKALAMTGKTLTAELTVQEKALAVQKLMVEGAGDALGDFDRTSGGAANQQRILKAQLEDVTAAIGSGVLPVTQKIVGALSKAAEGYNSLDAGTKSAISTFATFATAGVGVVGMLSFLGGKAIEARNVLAPMGDDGVRSMGKLGKAAAAAGGALGIAGTVYALNELRESLQGVKVDIDGVTKASTDELMTTWEDVARASKDLGTNMKNDFIDALGDAGAVGSLERLRDTGAVTGKDLEYLNSVIGDTIGGLKQQKADADATSDALGDEGLGGAADEATDALADMHEAMINSFDTRAAYESSVRDTAEALDGMKWAAFNAYTTVDDKSTLIDESAVAQDDYKQSIDDAAEAVRNQAADAVRAAEEISIAAGDGPLDAATKNEIWRGELVKVAEQLGPGDPLRKRLVEYLAELNAIPANKSTKVTVDLPDLRNRSVGGAGLSGYRAAGGPVSAGGAYVVGERGPELLQMGSSGGNVVPNHRLGGSMNINVTVVAPVGSSPADIGRELQAYLNAYQRNN